MVLNKKPKEVQTLYLKSLKDVPTLAELENFGELIKQLNNPPRQQLLRFLDGQPNSTVSDIYNAMGWNQSYCSQILSSMRKANLLIAERDGHFVTYAVNYPVVEVVIQAINKLYR